jgi:hypothetical protein
VRFKAVLVACASFGLCPTCARAADVLSTWSGGAGNWGDATRWNNQPPVVQFPNNGNGGLTYDTVITGDTVTLDREIMIQQLHLAGGTIAGSPTLTLNEGGTWSGGRMLGPGTTAVASGASFGLAASGGTMLLAGRTLSNAGTITFGLEGTQSAPALTVTGPVASTINNLAGATFAVNGPTFFNATDQSTVGTFNNAGTFIRSGIGTTTLVDLGWTLLNSGSVQVRSGGLLIGGGTGAGSSSGSFSADAGATLNFQPRGTDYVLAAGSSLTGAGIVEFSASGGPTQRQTVVNGSYAVTGTTAVSGTVHFNGAASSGNLRISDGTAFFNAAATAGTLNLFGSNANLGGSGTLTLTGTSSSWTAGTMSGPGTTAVPAGGRLSLLPFGPRRSSPVERCAMLAWSRSAASSSREVSRPWSPPAPCGR